MTQTRTSQTNPSAGHNPDMPPHSGAGASSGTGRGPGGRFAKGNPGGPGNPFARQVAAFRQEFMAATTKEDIAVIARAMIEKAKEGDCAAARIVLQYTLGKPVATVDPDRLDEMEWEQWQRENVCTDSDKVWMGMAASSANAIARAIVPVMQKEHFTELYDQLQEREERRREEEEEDREDEAAYYAENPTRRAGPPAAQASAPPPAPPKEPAPVMESPAKEASEKEGGTETRVSPVEAQTTEHDGQPASEEGVVAAADRVLRILGATVNKPAQTARRAANDSTDRQ
jgi:hypothetical protein